MATEPYVGARREIAFSKEATRGTKVTPSAGDWQPHEGFDFKPMVTKLKDEAAVGHIASPLNSHLHQKSSEGAVAMRFTKDFVGHIMNMLLGQVPTTSSLGGGVYRHVWALKNTNRHVSYTTTVKDPVRGFLAYPLSMANEASFDFNTESIAKVNLGLMGGVEEASGATSTEYSTTYEYPFFMPQHINVKIAGAIADLAAASAIDIASAPLTVSKNAAKRYKLGSSNVQDVINQRIGAAGTLEAVYDNDTLRSYAHTNVHKALGIYLDDGESNKVNIEFPKVSFEEWNPSNDNNAYMTAAIVWFAEYSTADGFITVTVENKISSYA